MKTDDFRELALALPEVTEESHMGQPDFRIRKKIFATLNDATKATLRLNSEVQRSLMKISPDAYEPAAGKWGERGWTSVNLKQARKRDVKEALSFAWRQIAPKKLMAETPRSDFDS